jgi:16S rRNA (uracil1498-N3)-methyltransferase
MSDRFFVEPPLSGHAVSLRGSEAHHLIHVMRARPGDGVTLFDGTGVEFTAQIERVGRTRVDLAVLSSRAVDRELPLELSLIVALPKGDRRKWLVEKAVELGVGRIIPLKTARSVAQPGPKTLERLRRVVIEASKQCGRNRLMGIASPRRWNEFLTKRRQMSLRVLAHPHGRDQRADTIPTAAAAGPVSVAVGPEGGFTDEEVSSAVAAGWQRVDLGPRTLRVETAAIFVTAIVVGRCGP